MRDRGKRENRQDFSSIPFFMSFLSVLDFGQALEELKIIAVIEL